MRRTDNEGRETPAGRKHGCFCTTVQYRRTKYTLLRKAPCSHVLLLCPDINRYDMFLYLTSTELVPGTVAQQLHHGKGGILYT